MHGWVLRDKVKMSKSKGTAFLPEDLINGTLDQIKSKKSYSQIKGIETFRFYCIGATQPGRDLNFSAKEYADTYKTINTIWNVYVYANEKFGLAKFDPSKVKIDEKKLSKLDKWVLSKMYSTIEKITELADKYELPWIPGELRELIVSDISRWYIMLNREKLDIYSDDPNKLQIMAVLFKVLFNVLLMLAPINPMLSEELFLKMFKPHLKSMGFEETESIHLQNWPEADKTKIDAKLEEEMRFVRDLIESIRALKEENKIRLRWPNKRIIIEPKEDMPEIGFPEIIKQIGNVKELEIKKSVKFTDNLRKIEHKYCNIYLDVSVNDKLLNERVVNDLIRNIQFSRKKNDYKVGETISLTIGASTDYLKEYLENKREIISDKVSAKKFEVSSEELSEENEKVFAKLYICPNKDCSASLKENINKRLKKGAEVQCPYCTTKLEEANLKSITYNYKREN